MNTGLNPRGQTKADNVMDWEVTDAEDIVEIVGNMTEVETCMNADDDVDMEIFSFSSEEEGGGGGG